MSGRVLVIDDLPFMRSLLRDVLSNAGFTVVAEAADGRQGMVAYARHEPDVVLLDITMPIMDGITALKRIMELDPQARVVMCSSLGEQELILRAIRLGARDFVVKPFRPERVTSAVHKALKNHSRSVRSSVRKGLESDG